MAKGAAPSTDQLLDLLKRAAEELKHAQDESRTAVTALQREQAAHQKTEAELEAAKQQAQGATSQQSTDEGLLKDQIEAERENAKALGARVKELEAGLERAIAEREALRNKVTEADTAISISQQQEEAKRNMLAENHAAELTALAQEHANALQTAELESQRALEAAAAERAQLEAAHAQALEAAAGERAQLAEAHAREVEAWGLERTDLEGAGRAMLEDAAGKLVQLEQQLAQERDKHQLMAQKVLETRSKVRELEAAFMQEQERVQGLETVARQMSDAHEKGLRDSDERHAAATASIEAALAQTRNDLQRTTEAWQQVERQYEALHREMLMTLEQRDDARRQLESERSERERLSRALQGHR